MIVGGAVLPLGPQNEAANEEFGTIICRELQVVGADRRGLVMIGGDEHGELVNVHGNKGNPSRVCPPMDMVDVWVLLKKGRKQ